MLVPNYMQTWGLSRAFGGTIREWPLIEDRDAGRWRVDLEKLDGLVTSRTKMIVICNPEQPHRRPSHRRGARSHCARGRPARRVDPVGRGLSRRRARRPGDGVDVGPERARHHHQRAVQGLRASRLAHRMDRGAAVAHRGAVVVPRLRDDRARRAERSAGARGAGAGAAGAPLRAHARHPAPQPAAHRGLAAATPAASTGSGPKPARSSTCATTTTSIPPSSSPGCAKRRAC